MCKLLLGLGIDVYINNGDAVTRIDDKGNLKSAGFSTVGWIR